MNHENLKKSYEMLSEKINILQELNKRDQDENKLYLKLALNK